MGSNIVPDRLKLSKVADYIYRKTGVRVTSRAPYYWATTGKTKGDDCTKVKLKTETFMGRMFTRKRWVDTFVEELDETN